GGDADFLGRSGGPPLRGGLRQRARLRDQAAGFRAGPGSGRPDRFVSPFRAWLVAAALSGAATRAAAGWAGPSQPVRFAPERDYGPFVFQREDGRIDGLSVEMLGLLRERAGLNVHTLPARPLKEQ